MYSVPVYILNRKLPLPELTTNVSNLLCFSLKRNGKIERDYIHKLHEHAVWIDKFAFVQPLVLIPIQLIYQSLK